NLSVWIPVMARDMLHGDAGTYGLLMSAMGVGALAAGLNLAYSSRRAHPHRALAAAGAYSLVLLAFATTAWFPLALALMALLGVAMVLFSATANTTVQLSVPDELRG